MKNRIEKKFAEFKKSRKKALVAFVTAGDPNLKMTPKIVWELEAAGADIIELGMPFSDPMADGPVIQKSSERALKAGTRLRDILKTIREIRRRSQIPILLMGYFNPILQYGVSDFYADAKSAGADGTILVDLPPEEGEEARRAARKQGLSLVYLLSPTSGTQRIQLVRKKGSGFIYYVSLTGVTGAGLSSSPDLKGQLQKVLADSPLPVCVGFGIKTPGQARAVAHLADGVVVGSALVNCFAHASPTQGLQKAKRLTAALAKAVHSV